MVCKCWKAVLPAPTTVTEDHVTSATYIKMLLYYSMLILTSRIMVQWSSVQPSYKYKTAATKGGSADVLFHTWLQVDML